MRLLAPEQFHDSVTEISPQQLVQQGFGCVLLDIDNTLVPRDTHLLSEAICEWVAALTVVGLKVCLLSNNWHRTVFAYAERLNVPLVYKAMKPLPFTYLKARRRAGAGPGTRTVVIGDQLLTDVFGAHLLGWSAILVRPLSTTDLWYTQIFRKVEQRLMGGRQ
ncbi:MAG: YqeG family HAD IIIA-type phosphatase [Coriobacteriales bacterium]|nr:YqeG family HAD IIIA-type phosphatase [Coriobacteriales bacterium]